jgi:hypothetical protein
MSKKLMLCINNTDYVDCMTVGKNYWVEIEEMKHSQKMYKFLDDNNKPLQTMLDRFIPAELKKHDIVQVNPGLEGWGGCFVIVTEVKTWGIVGFVKIPYQGEAYIRVNNGDFEVVGEAAFAPAEV